MLDIHADSPDTYNAGHPDTCGQNTDNKSRPLQRRGLPPNDAVVFLAAIIGRSTENLSATTGPTLGGLLNATFGTANKMIFAFFALRAGKIEVVRTSIAGSMISNVQLELELRALAR